jgi:hypothetical protein
MRTGAAAATACRARPPAPRRHGRELLASRAPGRRRSHRRGEISSRWGSGLSGQPAARSPDRTRDKLGQSASRDKAHRPATSGRAAQLAASDRAASALRPIGQEQGQLRRAAQAVSPRATLSRTTQRPAGQGNGHADDQPGQQAGKAGWRSTRPGCPRRTGCGGDASRASASARTRIAAGAGGPSARPRASLRAIEAFTPADTSRPRAASGSGAAGGRSGPDRGWRSAP